VDLPEHTGYSDMRLGFSTGAVAKGDVEQGLALIRGSSADAVEVSALRDTELPSLIDKLPRLNFTGFDYLALHAPSAFASLSERSVLTYLDKAAERGWPIVIHPDAIKDWQGWRSFGELLAVENMDRRKACGRTPEELEIVFEKLPEAGLCFDIGHARQLDPSMTLAERIWEEFNGRIRHFHVSHVDAEGRHRALDRECLKAFAPLLQQVRPDVPLILESIVPPECIESELTQLREMLRPFALNFTEGVSPKGANMSSL